MAKTFSCLLVGVDVITVEIETVIGTGFSGLNILGLNTEATRDMRERIRSALESIGIPIPSKRIIVNITPSEFIKISRIPLSQLDFAVAGCIIYALIDDNEKQNKLFKPENEFLAGELSLSGKLKEIQNPLIYQSAIIQNNNNIKLCLPRKNLSYNSIFLENKTEFFDSIDEWYQKRKKLNKINSIEFIPKEINISEPKINSTLNIKEIENTITVLMKNPKLCVSLLIAALGHHHILIAGEPGVGKSFGLQKIYQFLDPLNEIEMIDVKLIHSVSSHVARPFRSPHHSATPAALIGGSSLKPGEVSLAHKGVLFLDELSEFSSSSLESLREPLDSGEVFISRAGGHIRYPAQFLLCATTNPCSCGYLFSKIKSCRCNPKESRKYLQKLSGPLLDRFCLQVWIDSPIEMSEMDIFSAYLLDLYSKKKIKFFSENFIDAKKKYNDLKKQNKILSEIEKYLIMDERFCSLSLRGQKKIYNIAFSFYCLFNEIEINKLFVESVMSFRELDRMFLQRNIF
ncbi:hypothetical protein GCL60_12895 [Silvanigrella paludirubra]|uniref:AAA+ ATPase domain-containing protein n=1 Tax=Silvanigrella paludirubra TaxID=2499159 RepID=A0A6N6VR66_9BACT|nr:ATP-binding protein [Silvanigrella paludirubra]KAB8038064.1 hypothetical protein GCL60_12895 [Silvanigrella paludirubra]